MMPPHLMRLIGTLRNSQSIVLSFWLAVLCCSQGIAGQGRAGLRAEVRRKSLRNFVARASSDQDPLGQEQASQAQAPQSSPSPDRKSVVWGKSVDLGGRRIIKKKKRRCG